MFTMYRGKVRMHSTMYWTIGFIILFTIGGATGVMHAMVPLDYNLHNTTFLVAHFHNVLVPGALFGFVAGYQYWFPKAFGFKLDEAWGKRAFWGWAVGFVLAFMPLYILGFMGLPRRIANIHDPNMRPLLLIAFLGACSVLFGIVSLVVQLVVSIRDREKLRDTTGDPWDGRTLEWTTSSPPPDFNFARVPIVTERDCYAEAKRRGEQLPLGPLEAIEMPKQTAAGLVIGASAFLVGFGAVWYMWWMFWLGILGIMGAVLVRSFEDDDEYLIPSSEVARMIGKPKAGTKGAV